LLGVSEGGALAALLAATSPQRCQRLVIYGAFARFPITADVLEPLFKYIDRAWGNGLSLSAFAPSRQTDPSMLQWWGRFERLGGSPAAVTAVLQMAAETDVSDIVSSIKVPTLVIHCKDDTLIPIECGRFLAQNIPDARFIELPGQDHLFFIHGQIGDCIEEFITGSVSATDSERVLATVLFTDIVGSTTRAERIGDLRWRDLLAAHDASVRRELARYRGSVVKLRAPGHGDQ
jgi:pimeloyl-ACP methyl ester carboxylesterase